MVAPFDPLASDPGLVKDGIFVPTFPLLSHIPSKGDIGIIHEGKFHAIEPHHDYGAGVLNIPVCMKWAGTFSFSKTAQKVTFSGAYTAGRTFQYTLAGGDPSIDYTVPFAIAGTSTVRWRLKAPGNGLGSAVSYGPIYSTVITYTDGNPPEDFTIKEPNVIPLIATIPEPQVFPYRRWPSMNCAPASIWPIKRLYGGKEYTGRETTKNIIRILDTPLDAILHANQLVASTEYTIVTVGSTDFTAIGSASNIVGTKFTATGAGTGTGTARPWYADQSLPRYRANGGLTMLSMTHLYFPSSDPDAISEWYDCDGFPWLGTATWAKTGAATGTLTLVHSNAPATPEGSGGEETEIKYTDAGGEPVTTYTVPIEVTSTKTFRIRFYVGERWGPIYIVKVTFSEGVAPESFTRAFPVVTLSADDGNTTLDGSANHEGVQYRWLHDGTLGQTTVAHPKVRSTSIPTIGSTAVAVATTNATGAQYLGPFLPIKSGDTTPTNGFLHTCAYRYGLYLGFCVDTINAKIGKLTATWNADDGLIIGCATSGATIKYSLDGGAYATYSTPVTLTGATAVSIYATKTGLDSSDIFTFTAGVEGVDVDEAFWSDPETGSLGAIDSDSQDYDINNRRLLVEFACRPDYYCSASGTGDGLTPGAPANLKSIVGGTGPAVIGTAKPGDRIWCSEGSYTATYDMTNGSPNVIIYGGFNEAFTERDVMGRKTNIPKLTLGGYCVIDGLWADSRVASNPVTIWSPGNGVQTAVMHNCHVYHHSTSTASLEIFCHVASNYFAPMKVTNCSVDVDIRLPDAADASGHDDSSYAGTVYLSSGRLGSSVACAVYVANGDGSSVVAMSGNTINIHVETGNGGNGSAPVDASTVYDEEGFFWYDPQSYGGHAGSTNAAVYVGPDSEYPITPQGQNNDITIYVKTGNGGNGSNAGNCYGNEYTSPDLTQSLGGDAANNSATARLNIVGDNSTVSVTVISGNAGRGGDAGTVSPSGAVYGGQAGATLAAIDLIALNGDNTVESYSATAGNGADGAKGSGVSEEESNRSPSAPEANIVMTYPQGTEMNYVTTPNGPSRRAIDQTFRAEIGVGGANTYNVANAWSACFIKILEYAIFPVRIKATTVTAAASPSDMGTNGITFVPSNLYYTVHPYIWDDKTNIELDEDATYTLTTSGWGNPDRVEDSWYTASLGYGVPLDGYETPVIPGNLRGRFWE